MENKKMPFTNPISHQEPGLLEEMRYEKIHNIIVSSSELGSKLVAQEIAQLIRDKQHKNETCVLGLATGSSPIKVYEELIRMHREEGLLFHNVVTFNLDEYYGLEKENPESYYHFMHEHLFDHIDIDPKNTHVPDGLIPVDQINAYCHAYDKAILDAGGLDFQLLGIGRTGHIGFNEPGSHANSATRSITLDHLTRVDASTSFLGINNVPRKAITMGIGTIKKAKRIVLLAWGENKASIIRKTIEGKISSEVPATYLQIHSNTSFIMDDEAASQLTRIRTPWLVANCDWTEDLKRKALVWLCEKTKKAILKLTDKDYNDFGMSDLLAQEGSAYDLNIRMFNQLQHTITGWPGGKPNAADENRPERALPVRKRVLIFSPHPDDDVISMGGTFDRLVEQGHEVHVAYQTSGNIAVSDEEALKFAEVAAALLEKPSDKINACIDALQSKKINKKTALHIREIKGKIRQKESLGATRFLGVPNTQVHFLNMPFYETGTTKKNKLEAADIALMSNLISSIQPHQIYAAGDLADPHGTHKVCLNALFTSLDQLKNEAYMQACWVWLYRGAWEEWEPHEIQMAIPMSEDQVIKKRHAIFFHQSQKDNVMFQGEDSREFWVRVEERTKQTAAKYNALGLAEYTAMEAFKRYFFH